jgi:hypothetical protein
MAYDAFDLGNGREEIRCTSGNITHIVYNSGKWMVEEDEEHRAFKNHGQALDLAREIAEDPDL